MSSIRVSGNTSGHYDLTVPDVAGSNTIALDKIVVADSSGNVGIGVTSPNNKLEVDGTIAFSKNGTSGNRWLLIEGADGTYAGTMNIQAGFGSSAAGGAIKLYAHQHATYPGSTWIGRSAGAAGNIMFGNGGTGPASANQIQVVINPSGNLGIGTTSPAQKLVVSGGTSDVSVLFNSTDTAYHNFGITKSGSLVKMGEFNNAGDTHSFPILSIEMNGDKVRIGDSTIGNEPLNVTFNGRAGIQVGSKTGEGAYIVLDGPNNGDGGGGDYAYIEHNSSGILNFNVGSSTSGTTTRMAIHPEGYILNDQPRFATRINYVSGFRSTGVISNWQPPHVNQGSHFNYSNGRFTAPVAGTYRFEFHTNVLRDGIGVYYLEWYKNGVNIAGTVGGRIYDQWDGGWANACGFVMMDLNVNDYVEFWHSGGPITLDGNGYGQYCGYLVG